MLEVRNVTFNYSAQGEQDTAPALSDVSLQIGQGETIAIIGHNGSGKSTLAKLFASILLPTLGSVLVEDQDTATARGEEQWTIRQQVGMVFQNPDDQLVASTVIDDIAFGPENIGLPRFEIQERVDEALHFLDLEPYAQMAISELSLGQKQRVAVAGVLAMRPRYLVLDEPTTMISGQTARHLLATLRRLAHERGITVIHITHYMHEVADFDRVIVMDGGRVVMDDTPVAIFGRAQELVSMGLSVPMVTQLGPQLILHGYLPDQVILSVEQLCENLINRSGNVPQRESEVETYVQDAGQDAVRERAGRPQGSPLHVEIAEYIGEAPAVSLFPPAFEVQNVSYTYLRNTPLALEALRDLSFTVAAGRTIALVGATNSGKSTVVDLLAYLLKPTAGAILFEGKETASKAFDVEQFRAQVGVVFQSPESQIFEDTVGKDVSFGLRRRHTPLAESRRLVQESLQAVGLSYEDFRTRYTYALSGGQKRRVAIAGVLALQPRVIIFDEPMAGLDPRGRDELVQLIATLKQREELTIIYASSSLEDVVELADIVYILDAGQLVMQGNPKNIVASAEKLQSLDITLPEATRIALLLRNVLPSLRTDILDLEELESELWRLLPQAKNMGSVW